MGFGHQPNYANDMLLISLKILTDMRWDDIAGCYSAAFSSSCRPTRGDCSNRWARPLKNNFIRQFLEQGKRLPMADALLVRVYLVDWGMHALNDMGIKFMNDTAKLPGAVQPHNSSTSTTQAPTTQTSSNTMSLQNVLGQAAVTPSSMPQQTAAATVTHDATPAAPVASLASSFTPAPVATAPLASSSFSLPPLASAPVGPDSSLEDSFTLPPLLTSSFTSSSFTLPSSDSGPAPTQPYGSNIEPFHTDHQQLQLGNDHYAFQEPPQQTFEYGQHYGGDEDAVYDSAFENFSFMDQEGQPQEYDSQEHHENNDSGYPSMDPSQGIYYWSCN